MDKHSALDALIALEDTAAATKVAKANKVQRRYLGVTNPQIDQLYKGWRETTDIDQRVDIAAHLWDSDIHEARIAAAKLLTQARINPDDAVWAEIVRWVDAVDATSIADQVFAAGARRLAAHPNRMDQIETWVTSENQQAQRSAFSMTLPWAKLTNPTDADVAFRDRVLGWAADLIAVKNPSLQRSIAAWLRILSKHDKQRVVAFLDEHAEVMKSNTLKEAQSHL